MKWQSSSDMAKAGWRRTRTPWVAFLDDDVRVGRDWRQRLTDDLSGLPDRTAGVQGRITVPAPEGRRPTDWERGTMGLAGARWITAARGYVGDTEPSPSNPTPEGEPAPIETPGGCKDEWDEQNTYRSVRRNCSNPPNDRDSAGEYPQSRDTAAGLFKVYICPVLETLVAEVTPAAYILKGAIVAYSFLTMGTLCYSVSLWMIETLHCNVSFLFILIKR